MIQGPCACPPFVGLVGDVFVSCLLVAPNVQLFCLNPFFGQLSGGGKGGLSAKPPYLPAARPSGSAERVAQGRLYGRQGFMATNARLRTFVISVKGDVRPAIWPLAAPLQPWVIGSTLVRGVLALLFICFSDTFHEVYFL